jgi:hypothetical protein
LKEELMRGFILAGAIFLAACPQFLAARPAKYRPWGMSGGYKDKALGSNSWKVVAGVNGMADEGSAGKIALYRAAELTRNAGFSYFQITNQKGAQTFLGFSGGPANIRGAGGAELTIIAVNDPAPPTSCKAKEAVACFTLNAQEVMERIRPFLIFPENK